MRRNVKILVKGSTKIRYLVAVIVGISIVTNAILIKVGPLFTIDWKGISPIRDAISVVIFVTIIADAIHVSINRFKWIKGESVSEVVIRYISVDVKRVELRFLDAEDLDAVLSSEY